MDFLKKKILRYEYLGLVGVLVIFLFFNLLPKFNTAAQLNMQIRQARSAVKTLSKKEIEERIRALEEQLAEVKDGAQQIKERTQQIKAAVPETRNVPMVTLEIEDLAKAAEVTLASLKPMPFDEENEADHEILPIEITFQSTYTQLVKFVKTVEQSSSLLAVHNLKVQKDELSYPLLDVRMAISVLLRKEKPDSEISNLEAPEEQANE